MLYKEADKNKCQGFSFMLWKLLKEASFLVEGHFLMNKMFCKQHMNPFFNYRWYYEYNIISIFSGCLNFSAHNSVYFFKNAFKMNEYAMNCAI